MGLADRPYMREPDFRYNAWSVTAKLMLVIAAAFVAQMIVADRTAYVDALGKRSDFVNDYLTLSLSGLAKGRVWQLLTFQFLHSGFLHLIFNLITIWFFGRALEEAVGARRMLQLYFASGVFGGVLQMAAAWLVPQYFGGAVVGASAGAFGLVAAFATLFPDRLLTMLVFLIIPVSMPARTLLWISIAIAALGPFVLKDNVAHAAHLGGIAAGVAFIHWRLGVGTSLNWRFNLRRRPRPVAKVTANRSGQWLRPPPEEEELPPGEFISREVDPILDKISQHGIHSLTERERKILERARERMARR